MEEKNEYDITVIEGNKVFHGTFVMKTFPESDFTLFTSFSTNIFALKVKDQVVFMGQPRCVIV